MIAYKMFRVRKDGTLGSLFIDKKRVLPIGKWLWSQPHPTQGYAYRPGWHCLPQPEAPHLKLTKNRVWAEVEIRHFTHHGVPLIQGTKWYLASGMRIKRVLDRPPAR